MSDSGRINGDCEHGHGRDWCPVCLRARVAALEHDLGVQKDLLVADSHEKRRLENQISAGWDREHRLEAEVERLIDQVSREKSRGDFLDGHCEGLEKGFDPRLQLAELEIARLKRGDFAPEELQNLCHNLAQKLPGCTVEQFRAGCLAYQVKLFGQKAVAEAIYGELNDVRHKAPWTFSASGSEAVWFQIASVLASNLAEEAEG